jgi:hypothetical protein
MCNHQAYVKHPGIFDEALERYGSIGELGQVGLTPETNGYCVW